jgi:hypothetical protein
LVVALPHWPISNAPPSSYIVFRIIVIYNVLFSRFFVKCIKPGDGFSLSQ